MVLSTPVPWTVDIPKSCPHLGSVAQAVQTEEGMHKSHRRKVQSKKLHEDIHCYELSTNQV